MDKIWIVLKSEFWRRVKSKWFILTTLLVPVLLVGLAVLPGFIAATALGGGARRIAVVDRTGVLLDELLQASDEQYLLLDPAVSPEEVQAGVRRGAYEGFLLLPAGVLTGEADAVYYSAEGGGLSLRPDLQRLVDRAVEQQRLAAEQAPPEVLEILAQDVGLQMVKLTEEGETADTTIAYSIVGYVMGFTIYLAMFIYGATVMHGVMEEKTSRVVEVMASAVQPFRLLMGKVLGIGAMGLVQMLLWTVFLLAGIASAGSVAALLLDPADFDLPDDASREAVLQAAEFTVPDLSVGIFVGFILFFLGGYLLYASLFAAIGSAVEEPQDAQGLMMPISLLIITPIIFIAYVIESPGAPLSVALSLFPFFSPILMVVRIAVTEVPFWQEALAFVLLVGTFVGAVWLSSRIYRVGILMYGKKASLRDLVRWLRYA